MADKLNSDEATIEKPTSTTRSPESRDDKSRHRKRRDRSRSSSVKRHRHKRSRSRSRSRHHRQKRHRHTRSRSPRRKRSRSRSRSKRRSPRHYPIPIKNRNPYNEIRVTEDDKKRIHLEALQKLKDMAANDTLDLSLLTIDDLKKTVDVPKELRSNQGATIMYQMDEIRKLIEELSGISIPKIYNTGAINPLQYAQQQRKRKLLWSKTNDKTSTSKVGAAITDGQDEKTAEKFRKLLGMKTGGNATGDTTESDAIHQQQQDTFDSLDKEYQTARITTHLRRGVGLGFLSQGSFVPSSADKN
ncbi:unnamed protein product [Rotaria magnacalcarata]|uniref:Small acidic protein-like domain-containing protein n=6 Tax=Rotaria TaxID=231623 RepID=A0A817A9Y2_9BILA|nr:unnamed protein product [Rotaria magnacalcarata]CAF1315882.1 unnamed protein product [Rotaria magnacalcarata]CAF2200883.1 unnamed protein product [Rotaria magnacalcarata]CAF2200931.1 unnamed protein product [Rotaria magnacalcarata]CAF2256006.1 unnamed protein product [Rotaria magnacalcarata]